MASETLSVHAPVGLLDADASSQVVLEDGRQGLGRMGLFSPTRIEVREMRKSEGERYRGLDEVRDVAS